jgi:hypothetical protein
MVTGWGRIGRAGEDSGKGVGAGARNDPSLVCTYE